MQEKQRLDAFLSDRLPDVSRAKLQSGIKEGLVRVNGKLQTKASQRVKQGDSIWCKLPPPQELDAVPEVGFYTSSSISGNILTHIFLAHVPSRKAVDY